MTDPKGLVALIEKYIERNADEHGKQWRTDGFNALSYSSYYNGANSMKDHLLKLVDALERECSCEEKKVITQYGADFVIYKCRACKAIENFKREMGDDNNK